MSVYSSSIVTVTAALLVSASPAGAQQTWSPFIGVASAPSAGPPSSVAGVSPFVVEPGALVEAPRGSMLARWSAPVTTTSLQLTDADLALRLRLRSLGRFESSLLADSRYDHSSWLSAAEANGTLRLQLGTASGSRGFQFGAGVDGWRSTITRNATLAPTASISGWIRRFGLSFSAEVSARAIPGTNRSMSAGDTVSIGGVDSGALHSRRPLNGPSLAQADTAIPYYPPAPAAPFTPAPARHETSVITDGHAFGDAALRVSGILMSLGIDGLAGIGVSTGGRARGYGSLILTRWISSGFALTGGVVLQPPEPGSSGGRAGGLLGIRLAQGPRLLPHFVNAPKVGASSCTIRILDGTATIEVRAPAASHVELSGDFTRWLPASLDRAAGDKWTLAARLAPGVHRFVVRIDGGAWLPVPGLPQAVDSYEGTVSVIVAP